MDTNIVAGAVQAVVHQAAAGTLIVAGSTVVLSTLAWIAASLAAGKARQSH